MPAPIFDDPRLAVLYDVFDGDRDDLDAYVALVDELGARSVLDVGCGTGTFARGGAGCVTYRGRGPTATTIVGAGAARGSPSGP